MTLIPWPSDKVGSIWERVMPVLEKAISFNTGYLPEDVLYAIESQRMQLFVVADDDGLRGAIVTEIHVYPRSKSLFVLFLGGTRLSEWPMDALWRWARLMGCDEAMAIGRRGMDKMFPEAKTNFKYYQLSLGGDYV